MPGYQEVTLRPDGTNDANLWTPSDGTTLHGVTSDNSDATYATVDPGNTTTMRLAFADPPFNIAELDRYLIVGVQLRMRIRTDGGDKEGSMSLYGGNGGHYITHGYEWEDGTYRTRIGGWKTAWVGGSSTPPHTIEPGDLLTAEFRGAGAKVAGSVPAWQVSEVYLDVRYNEKPSVAVTGPVGVISDPTPELTWDYTDAENDPQTHRHVVVEEGDTSANGAPGGGESVVDTGKLSAFNDFDYELQESLENGQYTAWVRVWHDDVNGQQAESGWDSTVFTVDVPPPGTPTLTVQAQDSRARVELTADSDSPGGQEAEEYDFQYSDDGGSSWIGFRENPVAVAPVDSAETIYDNESPLNQHRRYRVRAARYVDDNRAVSPWSDSKGAAVRSNSWWLKAIHDPSLNTIIEPEGDAQEITKPRQQATFNPLGRKHAVVVKDTTPQSDRFDLEIGTITEQEYQDLLSLWESGDVMLLQRPDGKQWYVDFGSPFNERLLNLNDPWRKNRLSFIEVDRPDS